MSKDGNNAKDHTFVADVCFHLRANTKVCGWTGVYIWVCMCRKRTYVKSEIHARDVDTGTVETQRTETAWAF